MLLNRADLDKILAPGMNTRYMKDAAAIPASWNQIADLVPSTQGTETYPWLGGTPGFSEFKGERQRRKITQFSFTVTNKEYEDTIAISRAMIDDDNAQYSKLQNLAGRLGRNFPVFLDQNVFGLLPAGATTLCYDGQYFFDTDHSEGSSGTQSNKSTTAFSAAQYASARAAMMNFKNDQGVPVGVMPNLLVVPGDLEKTALEVLKAVTIEGASFGSKSNVYVDSANLHVTPYLTDTNNWYLLDTRVDKPLIVQERVALEVGFKSEFVNNEIDYGAYWRGAFAYGDWRRAYGGIVA